jgi:hypothetical protein
MARNFWLPFMIFPVKVLRQEEEYFRGLGSSAGIEIGKDSGTPSHLYCIPMTNSIALVNLR